MVDTMPLRHTNSLASIASVASGNAETNPSGPLSGPSNTTWRRQRLLRIGSSPTTAQIPADSDESQYLRANQAVGSYGTLPARHEHPSTTPSRNFLTLRNFSSLSGQAGFASLPVSPTNISPTSFRDNAGSYFGINKQRPISAYDAPFIDHIDSGDDLHARTNGIRVWYSSFSSIDWLHDAIKDSVRFSRLRRGKSIRSKIRLLLDKSMGWIIVTLVGFFTAWVAFLVVRSEQWLFDSKEGYCRTDWTKPKRFCCPISDIDDHMFTRPFSMRVMHETCPAWRTWAELFGASAQGGHMIGYQAEIIQYVAYTFIALSLALVSCLLTIYLTKSTSFITRKESGVLSPNFTSDDNKSASRAIPKRKVLYYAAGSGIPEIKTILSGFVIHGYLGGRVLFTKSVGLALSVASGLSLGKEGPFVHIASCIGNIISRYVAKYENNEGKRREILSAACAAGVAVAFGAPIGGTLFSLEEVSYFFPPKVMWRSFFCAMIAAITLRFLDPFGTGKLVLFQVTYVKDWHAYELIFFLLLGVFGGIYGAYFSKLNFYWSRNVRNGTWLKDHPVSEVMLVTLVTTVLCFLNPYTRMGGTELVYELFAECRTGSGNTHSGLCVVDLSDFTHVWPVVSSILVAMVVKSALTVVTFGIKVPAGIFIPTLGVGACAGRLLGIAMQWLHWKYPESAVFEACHGDMDCVVPGLYAMVGAAAALSGVTRTTVSLAVIMFELTDTLTYAVPVMLAVLVAKTLAGALEPKGIYDLVIELSQLPFLDVKTEYIWGGYQIDDVTDRDVDVISIDRENTVETLRDQLQNLLVSGHDDAGFPILTSAVDEEGTRLVGYIGASELEHALSIVADVADRQVFFYTTFGHTDMTSSSASSFVDHPIADPFDFSVYMDQAPLTIQSNSPLELVHQFFVKLGARIIVVTDPNGEYEGIIDKKTWLAFLSGLEERS